MIDRKLLNTLFKDPPNVKKWSRILTEKPTPAPPIVSKQDIDRGLLDRYFVRPVNDTTFVVEIDEIQYEKFRNNPRFTTVQLRWKIIGKQETEISSTGVVNRGVREYNEEQVTKADLTFKVLYKYITNYTEYWISETRT